jgi:hypothetical protein
MLFMAFLHYSVTDVRGVLTSWGDDADPRRTTAGVPQGADAGAAEPEAGVASEDRPGLAVAQLQLHAPAGDDAERVVPLRRDDRDTLATA